MITQKHKWRRWSGSRESLTEAIQLASDELTTWNKFKSDVDTRISFSDNVTETSSDPSALLRVQRSDLQRIELFWANVTTNHREWLEAQYAKRHSGDPTSSSDNDDFVPDSISVGSSISFRMYGGGLSGVEIEVNGDDRTQVTGLMMRLKQHMDRNALGPTFFPSTKEKWFPAFLLAFSGVFGTTLGYGIFFRTEIGQSQSYSFPQFS